MNLSNTKPLSKFKSVAITSMLMAFLFCGCPYGSSVPLSAADAATWDESLIGTWQTTEKRLTGLDSVELIIKKGEGTIYTIEHRVKKPDNTVGLGWSSELYTAHLTRVKQKNVLNVTENKAAVATPEYLFFIYEISGSTVKFSVVSDDAMKQKKESPESLLAYFEENMNKKNFTEEERVFEKRK